MSNIFNTYSSSFKYDLPKIFTFQEEEIKNFLSKDLPNILNYKEIKDNINNYKNLKQFLGKKRKNSINKDEFIENQRHFKVPTSLEKINNLSVLSDINNNLYIEEENNYLTIFENPRILIKLFDSQSINVDLINDNESFQMKAKELENFNYNIYSMNKENKIIVSNELELQKEYNKSIEIEKENIYPYLFVMNSQIPEITTNDLLYENIYRTLEGKNGLISPKDISSIFFYYFRISSEMQNKYVFIDSDNRKNLYSILSEFMLATLKNILIILGPKGIGKTTSLIKFSFNKIFRIFYFNLESFYINSGDKKIKELKIQTAKVFGKINQQKKNLNNNIDNNINNSNNNINNILKNKGNIMNININNTDNNNELVNIKSQIEDYIEKNCNINSFEFIYNIIKLFKEFAKQKKEKTFGFIIDQYSFNYKCENNNYNINSIINLINDTKNIKLILCPTINNIYSKEQINNIFFNSLNNNSNLYKIYYFQEFISKDKFLENIISEKDDEYKNIIDELGYSPKHFYDFHNSNQETYKKYKEGNIKNNIEEYFSFNNNKTAADTIIDILNILDLVKSEKLISSLELQKMISKLPLKYLKIIKYKINNEFIQNLPSKFEDYQKKFKKKNKNEKDEEDVFINYLKKIWRKEKNYDYDKIIEKNFFIDERNIEDYINNYFIKDKNAMNIYGNYYKTYIDNNNNLFDPSEHSYNYIYVYQLEFSINLLENIFLEIIYNHIKNENLVFSNLLDRGAYGGIFELLFGFFIQKSGLFSGEKIEQTIYISSLVPFNYSINYYSSYKKEIKNFKEFKLEKNDTKRKIPFKNTFIKQLIFNSKYYDMSILLKSEKENNYNLINIQATIMKDEDKRLTKDEHELISRSVKLNLENEYEINIEKAYFIYVLSKKNGEIEDQETMKDCDINNIEYIGFDLDKFEENNQFKINYDKALITDLFPIHNASSLLIWKKNEEEKYAKLKVIIDDKKNSSEELKDYSEYINILFKKKYDSSEFILGQFKYFELNYSLFVKNKEILNFLSEFSFLIFIINKDEEIYIHFNKLTYNCKNNFKKVSLKPLKKDNTKILFCFSEVPLIINKTK